MSFARRSILVLSICFFVLASCDEHGDGDQLPADPSKWVCSSSLIGPTQEEIDQYCASVDPGLPAPEFLRNPPPISRLEDKNTYDILMQDFLRVKGYVSELGWPGDLNWRLTGP